MLIHIRFFYLINRNDYGFSPRTDNYHDACIVYGDGDVHNDYGNDVRYSSCGRSSPVDGGGGVAYVHPGGNVSDFGWNLGDSCGNIL